MTTTRRAPLRLVIAAILAAFVGAIAVAPAHAAAYRFWSFYQLTDGAWAFAQKGSDQTTPADGSVDGWRFAVSDVSDTRFPRAVLTFDQICGSIPAQDGKKRVGVVVDYGRAADSADKATPPEPKAGCAVLATDATSTDALRTAAGDLRVEKQLVCAVSGYPRPAAAARSRPSAPTPRPPTPRSPSPCPPRPPPPRLRPPRRPARRRRQGHLPRPTRLRQDRTRRPTCSSGSSCSRSSHSSSSAPAARPPSATPERPGRRCPRGHDSSTPQPGGCGGWGLPRPPRARPIRRCSCSSSPSACSSSSSAVTQRPPTRSRRSSRSASSSSPSGSS